MVKYFIFITAILIFVGCAANDNPRKGGLFGGLHGIISNNYDNRLRERDKEILHTSSQNVDSTKETKNLEREVGKKEKELEIERQKYKDLEIKLNSITHDLQKYQSESDIKKSQVIEIEDKIKGLNEDISKQRYELETIESSGGCEVEQKKCLILKEERDRLAQEIEELFKYHNALSDLNN